MAIFEKLYTVEDRSKSMPQKVLGFINENFKILGMTLDGGIDSSNVADGAITLAKLGNDVNWPVESETAINALISSSISSEVLDGNIQAYFQASAPSTGMLYGDIWIDTDGHTPPTTADVYRYEDTDHGGTGTLAWRNTLVSSIGYAFLCAYNADNITSAKITVFYQDAIPTALAIDDMWVDIGDNNKIYRAFSVGADAIATGKWETVLNLGIVRSATTFVIADEATSAVPASADYRIPKNTVSAQDVINAAINALPATGGKISLQEGNFIIDAPIVVSSNVTIEGQGSNTTVKKKDNCSIFPEFNRDSAAYYEQTYYAARKPRFAPGRFGNGIILECDAKNMLTVNQSDVEIDTTGFTAMASATLTRDTSEHLVGTACLKVVTPNVATAEGFYVGCDQSYVNNEYIGSVYLKGSGTITLRIRDVTNASQTTLNITLTSTWTRYYVRLVEPLDTEDLRLEVYTQSKQVATFYADCLMIESSADYYDIPTSWIPSSIDRVAESIAVPCLGVINEDAWAIEFNYTSFQNLVFTNRITGLIYINKDTDNYYLVGINASGYLYAKSYSGGVATGTITDNVAMVKDTVYSIMITSNGSQWRLCKNGAQVGSDTSLTKPVGTLPATLKISSVGEEFTEYINGIIDDLRISNKYRTLVEHQTYYNGTTPHVSDANTIMLASFDDVIDNEFLGMIINSDLTNGNEKINIMSLQLDGNKDYNYGYTSGIYMEKVDNSTIAYCDVNDTVNACIQFLHCNNNKLPNNQLKGSVRGDGLYMKACDDIIVSGISTEYNYDSGIQITYDSSINPTKYCNRCVFSGCISNNNEDGIEIMGGYDCIISNNNCNNNSENGIISRSSSKKLSINNNIIQLNGENGIQCGSKYSSVVNNVVTENSQLADNTYAGIVIEDDYINVQNNIVKYGDLTNRHKYGILIDGSCDYCTVTNNELQLSGFTASLLDDSGVSTNKTSAGNNL